MDVQTVTKGGNIVTHKHIATVNIRLPNDELIVIKDLETDIAIIHQDGIGEDEALASYMKEDS